MVTLYHAGIALLHLHCAHNSTLWPGADPAETKSRLEKSLGIVEPCLRALDTHRLTFLCGAAGPLALAAHLYHKLGLGKLPEVCFNYVTLKSCYTKLH